jgi:hypothetical protein
MRKLLAAAVVLVVALVGLGIAGAHAADFKTEQPTVTCDHVGIDPPADFHIVFAGTIGGQPVSLDSTFDPVADWAQADISAYTTAAGPITYSLQATFNAGPYGIIESQTATGTLTCHDPATTTTTTAAVPSSTTTTSVEIGTPVTTPAPVPAPVAAQPSFTG